MLPRRALLPALGALGVLAPVLAACGGDEGAASSSRPAVAVTATDQSCELARTDLAPGPVAFAVTNKGSSVTEVYVYGQTGATFSKVIGEVENIGPGTTRYLETDLSDGTYEVACKPGQKGSGIRTRITVAGTASPSGS